MSMSISKSNNIQAYLRDFANTIRSNYSYVSFSNDNGLINPQNFTSCLSLINSDELCNELNPSNSNFCCNINDYNNKYGTSYYAFTGSGVKLYSNQSPIQASYIKSGVSVYGVIGTESLISGAGVPGIITNDIDVLDLRDYSLSLVSNLAYRNFNKVYLPSTILSVGSGTFVGCSSLKEVYGIENCTSIDYTAFADCTSLESINLRDAYYIGTRAFSNCINLQSVYLSNATTISAYAFCYCSKLSSITLPSTVEIIHSNTFNRCYNLSSVTFGDYVTSIGNDAFAFCSQLNGTISLSLLSYLGGYAFSGCKSLKGINFPSLSIIYSSTFDKCSSLSSAVIPNVKVIYDGAFFECGGLVYLELPKINVIYSYAFYNCYNLKKIVIGTSSSTTVCTLYNSNAFSRYYNSIYVPASLLTSYKIANNWSYLSSIIYGY